VVEERGYRLEERCYSLRTRARVVLGPRSILRGLEGPKAECVGPWAQAGGPQISHVESFSFFILQIMFCVL
jgi:hypothetical protein